MCWVIHSSFIVHSCHKKYNQNASVRHRNARRRPAVMCSRSQSLSSRASNVKTRKIKWSEQTDGTARYRWVDKLTILTGLMIKSLAKSIQLPIFATLRFRRLFTTDKLKAYIYHVQAWDRGLRRPTQPDSHYIRYTAASVLRRTTQSTPDGHWLTCAW